MGGEGKNRGVTSTPQNPNQYGTFQGVANYYPPFPMHPSEPFVGSTQSFSSSPLPVSANPYVQGYQTVTGYPVEEGAPHLRRDRLPVCGLGIGWLLFFLGFFFGGIPWYVGTCILLFVQVDYREKAGYLACVIASALAMIAIMFGVTRRAHVW